MDTTTTEMFGVDFEISYDASTAFQLLSLIGNEAHIKAKRYFTDGMFDPIEGIVIFTFNPAKNAWELTEDSIVLYNDESDAIQAFLNKKEMNHLHDMIAALTKNNNHNYAVYTLAKFLNEEKFANVMDKMIDEHNKANHMPTQFLILRDALLETLLGFVKERYGNICHNQIKSAF